MPSDPIAAYLGPILTGEACEPILRQIPRNCMEWAWPQIEGFVASVAKRSEGRLRMRDIVECILSGKWQLWVVYDGTFKAAVATEIMTEASGMKVARIVFTTGRDAEQWKHLIKDIEDWARHQDCTKLEMMARKGWAKHLPDYKLSHVLLEVDL